MLQRELEERQRFIEDQRAERMDLEARVRSCEEALAVIFELARYHSQQPWVVVAIANIAEGITT